MVTRKLSILVERVLVTILQETELYDHSHVPPGRGMPRYQWSIHVPPG